MAIVRPYRNNGPRDDWEATLDLIEAELDDLNRNEPYGLLAQMRAASLFLVARDGDRVVGFVALKRDKGERHEHIAQLRIHVARDYRSNGVGAKLLRRALWWADRNGITRTVAMPYIDSGPLGRLMHELKHGNIKFFEKHGFKIEGLQRNAARLLDGTYTDVALMARVTTPAKEDA